MQRWLSLPGASETHSRCRHSLSPGDPKDPTNQTRKELNAIYNYLGIQIASLASRASSAARESGNERPVEGWIWVSYSLSAVSASTTTTSVIKSSAHELLLCAHKPWANSACRHTQVCANQLLVMSLLLLCFLCTPMLSVTCNLHCSI